MGYAHPMRADTGRTYICIDLKSFYASVECAERGLDPFTTNLVVADPERTEKTICLAITPAMKELGIRNRCRLFEIPAGIDYLVIKPRMRHYMEVSAQIYSIYLRFIAPEDIHVYSIDECFIDATPYLGLYGKTARQIARMLMDEVFAETRITATAGIGTNLFLCKLALDITAKHVEDGIGFLDEDAFRRTIWNHRPITDIWNIGPGIANRLLKYGVKDLEGVARMPPSILYEEFGVNAEFLIDHANGIEPCTIAQIHAYEPQGSSITNGQVLSSDYSFEEGLVVLREMVEASVLELVEKHLVTDQLALYVGYARERGEGGSERWFEGGHGKRALGAAPRRGALPPDGRPGAPLAQGEHLLWQPAGRRLRHPRPVHQPRRRAQGALACAGADRHQGEVRQERRLQGDEPPGKSYWQTTERAGGRPQRVIWCPTHTRDKEQTWQSTKRPCANILTTPRCAMPGTSPRPTATPRSSPWCTSWRSSPWSRP